MVGDLAGAVSPELDGAIANYELLFGVNTVSRAEFLHMHQELATWQPLIQACALLIESILESPLEEYFSCIKASAC